MSSIERRLPVILVAGALAAFALTRLLFPVQGLGNPDIGGILYSADTLNAGLLPYHDTVDVKQPGAFFVVAAALRVSRDLRVVHAAYALWLLLGAPAIWIAARALYRDGERPLWAPAIATALYLVTASMFDFNYSSWMMPPYAWSFAMLLWGLGKGGVRAHVLAGLFACIAYLFKAQAVVLAPLFPAVFAWSRRRGDPGATWRAWPAWIAGAALGLLPIVALYGSRHALPDLARGLFPVGDAAAYSARSADLASELATLYRVPRQQIRAFYLPLTLGLAAIIGIRRAAARSEETAPIAPSLLLYAASIIGCGLGGHRFFTHYLPQCIPAVVLLGAHPAALSWLLSPRAALTSRAALVACRVHGALSVIWLVGSLGRIPLRESAVTDNLGSPAVERAGKYIRERTDPEEHVLVWGWSGWGVYYFSERRSPSPIFKVLGQVTEYNDNTGFTKGSTIHYKPGPLADRLMEDLRARPPAFIVRARPFFTGMPGDPMDEWPELRSMLARSYRAVETFGQLTVYERKMRGG